METCRGNILFLVLIAVALFAALSFALTSGSRNKSPGQRETAKLEATKILTFASQAKVNVDRLRFSDCPDVQLDFGNTSWHLTDSDTNYTVPVGHNPNAPTDRSCALFHPSGMGMPILNFSQSTIGENLLLSTTYAPGSGRIIMGSVSGLGAETRPELILQINYLREEVCREINDGFGLTGVPIPEQNPSGTVNDYSGAFPSTSPVYIGSGTSAVLYGRDTFCYKENPSPASAFEAYHFNKVLITR